MAWKSPYDGSQGDGTPTDGNMAPDYQDGKWAPLVFGNPVVPHGGGSTEGRVTRPVNQDDKDEQGFYCQRDNMVGGTDETWQRDSGVGPDVQFNPNWGSAGDNAPTYSGTSGPGVDRFGDVLTFSDLAKLVN